MTKQEEIREGVLLILQGVSLGELSEYEAIAELDKLGVVIKVGDVPCLRCKGSGEVRKWQEQYIGEGYWTRVSCPKCKGSGKSGYVSTIPIIKEVSNGTK